METCKIPKWIGSKVRCDLCGHEWWAVRIPELIRLQCPNCNNMVHFEEVE